jgi:hypothetical protein
VAPETTELDVPRGRSAVCTLHVHELGHYLTSLAV